MENLSASAPNLGQKENQRTKATLFVLAVLGFIFSFIGGFLISNSLTIAPKAKPSNVSPTPQENTQANSPQIPQDSTKFLPGKHYFEDTIMLISKDSPQISLVATVTRTEGDQAYVQANRMSYYDGEKWVRKAETKKTDNSTIVSGNLVKSWDLTTDPSRVLKQSFKGAVQVDNNSIAFSTGELQNEISVRSLPGYTKFMSESEGTIIANGISHQAYALYTRIYSDNASDIQFYNDPFGLTTDWIAFWDTSGNLYHIDSTFVDKPTDKYQTHQLGIMESADRTVKKDLFR